jgi:hypothetical protein
MFQAYIDSTLASRGAFGNRDPILNPITRVEDHSIAFFQTFHNFSVVIVSTSQYNLCEFCTVSGSARNEVRVQ